VLIYVSLELPCICRKIMATRPRKIRNLNLPEVEDVEPAEDEHDNSVENDNNENL